MGDPLRHTYEVSRFNPGSSGLGDILVALGQNRRRRDVLYVLPPRAAHLAPLFRGMAPVLVKADVPYEEGPLLTPSEEEMQRAAELLRGIEKPVAFCANCSPYWAHLRERDSTYWQPLVEAAKRDGRTLVQFGLSRNIRHVKGVTHRLLDLPLWDLAACLKHIGCYVGVDTGDRHLAHAVGACVSVFAPPDCPDYSHQMWRIPGAALHYYEFDQLPHVTRQLW